MKSPKASPQATPRSARSASSAEEVLKDGRHYMEYYGTFKMDSVHGRLFELQVYIESYKYHIMVSFAFCVIGLILWPIAALLALPVSLIAGKDRDLQMFKVILVLSTLIGLAIWLIPILIVHNAGGVEYFNVLIEQKQLNALDFADFFLSEFMILLTIVFAWAYHDIVIDTDKYKDHSKASWTHRTGEYGLDVYFVKSQHERLQENLAIINGGGEEKVKAPIQGDGTIPIQSLVTILESLPGWHSPCLDITNHLSNAMGEEMGLFDDLAKLSAEAQEKRIWPIDIWLTRTQFYPEVAMNVMTGLRVAFDTCYDMSVIVWHYVQRNPVAMVIIGLLSAIRTMLPRFWLADVLDGAFWPADPAGSNMVLYSSIVTFVVSFIWLGLIYMIVMEYRRTVIQMIITSALVDPKARVKFSQSFLMSCLWFGMGPEECEAVLSKLPLLDLRTSSNAAAFWRLREYCILDRCNERMCVSIIVEIVIIWLLIKFICTLVIMTMYDNLPAILIVTLFDVLVFGGLILCALDSALTINRMMEDHKNSVVNAKYMVTMAFGMCEEDATHSKSLAARRHDLDVSRRLLTEFLDITNEADDDARDAILFGTIVTPPKVLSSLATVGMMAGTLLLKMINSGQIKTPEEIQEHAKGLAFGVEAAAKSFLALKHRHEHGQ